MSKNSKTTFEFRDLIYILAVIVPVAATWGVYSTKINNLMDKVIEVRVDNREMQKEDQALREIIHNIQLEVNSNHSDINNLKEKLTDIINRQTRHIDKRNEDHHEE